jgi:hypothetical protein
LSPGTAVAGVGANTVGENLLPPLGSKPFSVGVADGAVVLVVVVGVVEGLSVLSLPQAAASAPSPTMAMAPAAAAKRRELMLGVLSVFSCWFYFQSEMN